MESWARELKCGDGRTDGDTGVSNGKDEASVSTPLPTFNHLQEALGFTTCSSLRCGGIGKFACEIIIGLLFVGGADKQLLFVSIFDVWAQSSRISPRWALCVFYRTKMTNWRLAQKCFSGSISLVPFDRTCVA